RLRFKALRRILLELPDEEREAPAAHIFVGGQKTGLRGALGVLVLEPREGGERRVADRAVRVPEHLPEALDPARIAEIAERLARLDARGRDLLVGELEQGAERSLILERGEPARAEQACIERPARHRLEERTDIGLAEGRRGFRGSGRCRRGLLALGRLRLLL